MNRSFRVTLAFFAAAVLALSSAGTAAASARSDAAARAATWLVSQQKSNGTFGADRSDYVAETIAAAIIGGAPKSSVDKAMTYVGNHGWGDATRGALTGRIIAGIVAAGRNPRSFGGRDYVAKLQAQYDDQTGAYDAGETSTRTSSPSTARSRPRNRSPRKRSTTSSTRSAPAEDSGTRRTAPPVRTWIRPHGRSTCSQRPATGAMR